MAEFGILSFGAYLPRKRLSRAAIYEANKWFAAGLKGLAKGERAIGDWDEDSITMAVEAGRDALIGFERSAVGSLSLASTTLPFANRLNSGIVKEALNLPDTVAASDAGGSQRAGLASLIQALQAAPQRSAPHLCLASDMRRTRVASDLELLCGDAAAGLLVGQGEVVARMLGSFSITADFLDNYRSTGMEFDYGFESRWVRDEGYMGLGGRALTEGLAALGVEPASIDRLIVPIAARGVPEALAKKAGISPDAVADILQARIGEAGTAHSLLMLVAALEQAKPGEKILVLAFGQGADILLLETTTAIADLTPRNGVAGTVERGFSDGNYMRWLAHRGLIDLEKGMRAEMDQRQPATTLWRHRKGVLGLVGGRCSKTGTVQFPKSDFSVHDRALRTQQDYPLADIPARIVSFTADSLAFSPAPPLYYGMIDFEGGGRMTAEFADVFDGETVEVGDAMRMVFRIKAVDEVRDLTKYFWKAAPSRRE